MGAELSSGGASVVILTSLWRLFGVFSTSFGLDLEVFGLNFAYFRSQVDDFDDANGGTYIVPGSHKWADNDPRRAELSRKSAMQVNMKSGSLFAWTGSLFHVSTHAIRRCCLI